MYRVLTISREFGSGGSQIARKISEWAGWDLLDQAFIQKIAAATHSDPEMIQGLDERTDSWIRRISRRALWQGAFDGVVVVNEADYLDSETLALLSRKLVEQAYEKGNCIIVGRGGQCILRGRPDVLHVFIYASWNKRLAEARGRFPEGTDLEAKIRKIEQNRTEYIRFHYGCSRLDPHLYHLMIDSELGEEPVIKTIHQHLGKNL